MNSCHSHHPHIEHVEEDVINEGIEDVDCNSSDHNRPYDALKRENNIRLGRSLNDEKEDART